MTAGPADLVIACVQMHSVLDPEQNLAHCVASARRAEALGVDLLIFPESTTSRSDDPSIAPRADDVDGTFVARLRDELAESEMTVIIGMTEEREGGLPFNTLVAFRRGGVVAVYRKLHLYDAAGARESDSMSPGNGPVQVFEVNGFRVGMMTCYDVRFPELARLLAERGADLLAVPTSWVSGPLKEDHWRTLCAARAIENAVYVAGACQTGGNRIGRSLVVAPDGVPEASAGYEETLLIGRISAERLAGVRERFPMLHQTRFSVDATPRPARASVGR
ncbi:MAG: Nitrilase/cyanide hydratase and apolipoprotein N-acyltransferase [Microbacterium sp.]|jgi:predicted amidohydrolase|nr:Nitrilase/cyanide hydratase and apolipoprotein N-acyltransferase [Microbacterium sp.]